MGKFRSKLKGQTKGKRWPKGQSSNSNPETKKYRNKSKHGLFQNNLGDSNLTANAVRLHEARLAFSGKSEVSTLAESLRDVDIADDVTHTVTDDVSEIDTESVNSRTSYKTFQTFASDWSECSNVSFKKLLLNFKSNSTFHKEMLAILAAITEIINEKGGTQSSTEYFAALMETLTISESENGTQPTTESENGIHATLSLLSMGIKSVPKPVLNVKFSDAGQLFMDLLEKYKDTEKQNLLRCILGCMSVLLRAQAKAVWYNSSNLAMTMINYILAFTIHKKPKTRKAAQHAIAAILRGSCFMLEDNAPKVHPAAGRVAEYCLQYFQGSSFSSEQTVILHTLTMLKDILHGFSKEDIKKVCESVLSIMTVSNVLLQKCCLETIYALFHASTNKVVDKDSTDEMDEKLSLFKFSTNLTSHLTVKLLQALYDYKPGRTDVPQMQAWVVVMQQGHVCLASLDFKDSLKMLPQFVETCAGDLWLSEHEEIANSATNALKEILYECVKPACETKSVVDQNEVILGKVFASISKALSTPFGHAATHVIHVLAVCFEIGGENCKKFLKEPLSILGNRRDPSGTTLLPNTAARIEHAIGVAIKNCGPEFVLEVIPLVGADGNVNIDRSWLLPILKDKIHGATIAFFGGHILNLATQCKRQCELLHTNGEKNKAHTYDLLCFQLWGLLPSFCNGPTDIKQSFKKIARVLGNILEERKELRGTVFTGLRKLISGAQGDDIPDLARFAKNFVPLLSNIIVNSQSDEGQKLAALETIQIYLTITPQNIREELFKNTLKQFEENKVAVEDLLDIFKVLLVYQSKASLVDLLNNVILPGCEVSKTEKLDIGKSQQKKSFQLVEQILKSQDENCVQFVKDNKKRLKKLLLQSSFHSVDSAKATKLRSLELLINSENELDFNSKFIEESIVAAVSSVKDLNKKCRDCAYKLLIAIGEKVEDSPDGLNEFYTKLIAGFVGEPHVVSSTLLSLSSVTYHFNGALGMENLNYLLQQCCTLLESPKREITSSAISYLHVYCKSLPSPIIANALEPIMKALSKMSHDCRKNSRLEIGKMLHRLSRKYGADTIIKYTPADDTVTHKRLRNIRKEQAKKKREREDKKKHKDSSSDRNVKQVAKSIEDILADSDSDLEEEEPEPRRSRKSKKNADNFWIEENADSIVDFTDPSAVSKITSYKPASQLNSGTKTKKDSNKGFKTDANGKLLISEDFSDSENERKRTNKFKGSTSDSENDSDDDMDLDAKPKLGKRKRSDAMSTKSGQSGRSGVSEPATKYRAGGHGIHRPVAASVRSGFTGKSSYKSEFGSEYRSNKASGDVKKAGRVDPYAYVPLSRSSLNKRKKAKNAGQFKGIVKGAGRGAIRKKAAGFNRNALKKYET